jgi:tripartite-type tricarboxylate transporter receptor subunit TctC
MGFISSRFLHIAVSLLVASLGLLGGTIAEAQQDYPNKPVRIVVPYAAGGLPDTLARIVGQRLQEVSGQPFLVENKPGAGGIAGSEAVAKAPADGYTLLGADQQQWGISPAVFKTLPYDPIKDFAPVVNMIQTPLYLAVGANVPVSNVREFVALMKKEPGKHNYGSSGQGSIHHLIMEAFKASAGIDVVHVPYKGSQLSLQAALSGEVTATIQTLGSVAPQAQQGKAKILAVASGKRDPAAPDVPTFTESGITAVEFPAYLGWIAPAGTPKPVIAWLNAEVNKALQHPPVRERFTKLSLQAVGGTPEEFGALIKADLEKYARTAKQAGIKPE